MATPQHIGIVGCSAEGAALCYKTICVEGELYLGEHAHPEVSMHTPSMAEYSAYLDAGDLEGVASLMLRSAEKLAQVGADFLICPDNTIHQAMDYVLAKSPLPWLHIAEVVAAEAKERGFKKPGILGTRWLVDSNVYPDKLAAEGLSFLRPEEEERTAIHHIIMDELVKSEFNNKSISYFEILIKRLKKRGCDAAILGCTEIPLIINDNNSALPPLDSNRLLARAALRRAVGLER